MTAKEFIKNRFNEIRNLFPELTFKYKFNVANFTHLIEVQPVDIFEHDKDYIKVEANFSLEFDNIFYPESLLFLSDNSLSKIDKPDFIFSAKKYGDEIGFLNYSIIKTEYSFDEIAKIDLTEQYSLAA
jgi:hypothetical protein